MTAQIFENAIGRCGCTRDILGAKPRFTPAMFEMQAIENLRGKAVTYEGSRIIQVDKALWARASHPQRMSIYAHELAHQEKHGACEPCTDQRAGALMRYWGFSLAVTQESLGSLVQHRKTRASAAHGWRVANAAIARASDEHSPNQINAKASALDRVPSPARGIQLGVVHTQRPETSHGGSVEAPGLAEKVAASAQSTAPETGPQIQGQKTERWGALHAVAAVASIAGVIWAVTR